MSAGRSPKLSETEAARLLQGLGVNAPITALSGCEDWNGVATCVTVANDTRFRLFHFPDNGGRAAKEASLLHRIGTEGEVPVPPVVGVDPQGKLAPEPTLVVRDGSGLPVFDIAGLSPSNQTALFRAYGETLAALHQIRYDAVGPIAADGTVREGTPNRWGQWMETRIGELVAKVSLDGCDLNKQTLKEAIEAESAGLPTAVDPVLVKGFYGFEGLLVDPDADPLVCAVRGFDRAIAAPAAYGYTVAHWSICGRNFRSSTFSEAFETGYRSRQTAETDLSNERCHTLYRFERILNEMAGIEQAKKTGIIDEMEATRQRDRLLYHLERQLGE